MIIAVHDGMTLLKLEEGSYCLTGAPGGPERCSGAVIGGKEAVAVLSAWGGFTDEIDVINKASGTW